MKEDKSYNGIPVKFLNEHDEIAVNKLKNTLNNCIESRTFPDELK